MLAMSLNTLRDVEPRVYSYKGTSIVYASISHLKIVSMFVYTHAISWVHHVLLTRGKSIS